MSDSPLDGGIDAAVGITSPLDASLLRDSSPVSATEVEAMADASVVEILDAATPVIPVVRVEPNWTSGTDGADRDWHQRFGEWRGRPTTATWIPTQWMSWDWLTHPGLLLNVSDDGTQQTLLWDQWADFKGIVALAMSMAGRGLVEREVYDQQMRECANGDYDHYWAEFAKNAKAAGRNASNTVVSLAQEMNGAWFPWNPARTSMETWMSCWKHTYTAIHSESDLQVAWVFSASATTMAGGDYAVANIWDAYPGDAYVDVLGLNRYDLMGLGPTTSTDWRDTCWNDQDICIAAKLAREHGKKLAVTEWSIERGQWGWADNPNFVQMMFGFFADNRDILLLENHFDNYGHGDWNLFPRQDNNANASDKYLELYKP